MKLKLILPITIAILSNLVGFAYDQNVKIPDITIPSGSVAYFQIDLEDDETTVAIGADIDLPDDFVFLAQENDANEVQYQLNLERNSKLTFESNSPSKTNDKRFILMTSDVSCIKGKTGWLVKIPLTTTVQPGTYEARMHTVGLTTQGFNENNQLIFNDIEYPDITVKITVTEPEEIRYSDNQLFCNDIEINQGENSVLNIYYNSSSEVYEYSADINLPTNVTIDGEVTFSSELSSIGDFTNDYSWDPSSFKISVTGEYGGRRADPAPAGKVQVATVKLNTAALTVGEYEIKINKQAISNDDDDYTPEEYVGKLIVKSNVILEKCSTPTISIVDNKLYVHSDTEGAVYHTSIVANDHKDVVHGEDEPIELGGQYLISTYASAEGYSDSEPATATLIWNKEDVSTSVDFDITMDMNRMLLIQSSGNNIVISGLTTDEPIALYEISGATLYQGTANSETFVIPFSCVSGQIYVIKVGTSSFKYLF